MKKKLITIENSAGSFAGNKDVAGELREKVLKPCLSSGGTAIIDFRNVTGVTQSFVHALISELVRESEDNLDHLLFKNCNDNVRSVIEVVVEYSQFQQANITAS